MVRAGEGEAPGQALLNVEGRLGALRAAKGAEPEEAGKAQERAWRELGLALRAPQEGLPMGQAEAEALGKTQAMCFKVLDSAAHDVYGQMCESKAASVWGQAADCRAIGRHAKGLGLGAERADSAWELAFNQLLLERQNRRDVVMRMGKAMGEQLGLSEAMAWSLMEEQAHEARGLALGSRASAQELWRATARCAEALVGFAELMARQEEPERARGWVGPREARLIEAMIQVCERGARWDASPEACAGAQVAEEAARKGASLRRMAQASEAARASAAPGPNVKQRKIMEGAEPARPRGPSPG